MNTKSESKKITTRIEEPPKIAIDITQSASVANQNISIELSMNKPMAVNEPVQPTKPEIPPPPPPPPPVLRVEPKLPEIQVPIKKYYGRKRDNQSSSDEGGYSDNESNDKSR